MKIHRLQKQIAVLLFALLFTAVTNAQSTQQLPSGIQWPDQIAYGQIFRCSLQDKAGNLWFGTTGAGVYRYDGKSFTNFREKDGLSNDFVYSMIQDKAGNIWFGTKAGVSCYNGKIFTTIAIPDAGSGSVVPYNSSAYPKSMNDPGMKVVVSLLQDKSGNIWFGTTGNGAYRYDGKTVTSFLYYNAGTSNKDFKHTLVQCLLEDKAGNIWFGSWRYDGKSAVDVAAKAGLGAVSFLCAMEDKAGNIWFGSRDNGVFRYDPAKAGFTNLSTQDGLCNNTICSIIQDKAGNLWFASDVKSGYIGGGVCKYDGKSFTPFTTKNGLDNNGAWTLVEDKPGNIWIGSRGAALCCYNGTKIVSFTADASKK